MKKDLLEKILKFIELFAGVCTITGVSVWSVATCVDSMKDTEYVNGNLAECMKENLPDEMMDESTESISVNETGHPDEMNSVKNINIQEEKQIEIIDVEEEVSKVRNDYYVTQQKKREFEQQLIDGNIRIYTDDNVALIEVPGGYNGVTYSRIYYFDKEESLYFAFVFEKRNENRLYFKNDTLIRYIDESGDVYDLYENLESCIWSELALSESYDLLKSLKDN